MEYKIIRSKRKTISISVEKNGDVVVKAPMRTPTAYIDTVVQKNISWIEQKQKMHYENSKVARRLTDEEISALKKQAKTVMTARTHYFEKIMGVKCTGIRITSAKGRWGSCSYNNSICYSYRTQLLDDKQQDYIVVHELAHIRHKDHSPRFYSEIEKVLPDYRQTIKSIKEFSNFDLY